MRTLLVLAVAIIVALGAEPTAAQLNSSDASTALAGLLGAGLPIGDSIAYTVDTDPDHLLGRTSGYLSRVAFLDTRLERLTADAISAGDGGTIEVFAAADGAAARKAYFDGIGAVSPTNAEYSYLAGP